MVLTDLAGGDDTATGVGVQADGKLVAAGVGGTPSLELDFALVRYQRDGKLDASFGRGVKALTDFARGGDVARAVALQPDGKIVASGETTTNNGSDYNFALVRYTN